MLPMVETCKVACCSCRRRGENLKMALTEARSQVERQWLGRAEGEQCWSAGTKERISALGQTEINICKS